MAYRSSITSEVLPGNFDRRWITTIYRIHHIEVIIGVLYLKVGGCITAQVQHEVTWDP